MNTILQKWDNHVPYTITYSSTNKHGYARISRDGQLQITVPHRLKHNQQFLTSLIEQGQKLFEKQQRKEQFITETDDAVMIFGELVSKWEVSWKLDDFLKTTLYEYALPLIEKYAAQLWYSCADFRVNKVSSKRWSCTHDQKIMLNRDLIHLPTIYTKYVAIHEVCHLKEKNHSARFWKLVEQMMPDYKRIRKQLRDFQLHSEG